MSRFSHARRGGLALRNLFVVATAALLLLVLNPVPSVADAPPVTVTVGATASLTNKVLVTVPVTVVCAPLPNDPFSDEVSVQVIQASGQDVSRASGSLFGRSLLTCDGSTPNNVIVSALPDPGSGPFHGGRAIVTAFASHSTGVNCGPDCFFDIQTEFGNSGPASVKLR